MLEGGEGHDVLLVEIGRAVGDIESLRVCRGDSSRWRHELSVVNARAVYA